MRQSHARPCKARPSVFDANPRSQRSPKHSALRLSTLLLGCMTLTGCDQVFEALSKSAEAMSESAGVAPSPDALLGMKLDAYIGCINSASSNLRRSMDRYWDWVDPQQGLTGNEQQVYGLFAVPDQTACIEGIASAAEAEPRDADLEAAGSAYSDALQAALVVFGDAHKYYDQKDYEDDGFAKGKALHPQLIATFEAFATADKTLRDVVVVQNDALLARELDRIEKELGQKLRWHQAKVMHVAKSTMEAMDASIDHGELRLDLPKFETAFAAFETALEAQTAYSQANKAETDSVTLFSQWQKAAEAFQKASKEMMRRRRDGTKLTEAQMNDLARWPERVEGSPMKVIKTYDELVQNSNRLNWHRYAPNG
jgi:tetratricopeptide (TPR) repeat protein